MLFFPCLRHKTPSFPFIFYCFSQIECNLAFRRILFEHGSAELVADLLISDRGS